MIVKYLQFLVLITLLLTGCATSDTAEKKEQIEWNISPTFTTDKVTVKGEKGRLAVLDDTFLVGKKQEVTWYFWGSTEEVTGKLVILGYSKETGKSQTFVDKMYTIPAKPKDGADNHQPTMISFPTKGMWRLDVMIDQQPFGSVILEVKE